MPAQSACQIALLGLAWVAFGCSDGASSDPALGSRMRISTAQFVPGATPRTQTGPEVISFDLPSRLVWPGYANKPIRGTLGATATAVTLALSGDSGYWVVQAGVADVSAPDLPTFRTDASFARSLTEGEYTLEARAVDDQGRLGAPQRQVLTALAIAPSRAATGELVVTLTWDDAADVDLHVVDPNGSEIYHALPSSRDPFAPADADASFGMLDVDSNADCAADDLRQEDVIWAAAPPAGHYTVRVDTPSLCSTPAARWAVQVRLRGEALAAASGIALESDTWGAHDRGAGQLVLGFDVP